MPLQRSRSCPESCQSQKYNLSSVHIPLMHVAQCILMLILTYYSISILKQRRITKLKKKKKSDPILAVFLIKVNTY